MKIFNKNKEKYYFCENCGRIATEEEMCNGNVDRLAYGSKICNCEYGYLRWDEKIQSFLPVYGKSFVPMVEIPKPIYEVLHTEENEIIRMRMYNSWKKWISKSGKDGK
jgi:hypothetical protein